MPTIHERYDEAIAMQQQGDLEGAVGKLHELLEDEPDYALAHAALSVFYSKMEKHDEAVQHARKVCDLESADPFSYIALSLICQKAGLIGEAEHAMMLARQAQMAAHQGASQ
ncbi:MAG TPA: hypothetical protein EYP56_09870 [Planctomycetaceae bacterium]|nr:hypothetical protein [Planctomycetaceae bacterium]HIQ22229.1 hypothetical protein [Planctomycetota bacterium]